MKYFIKTFGCQMNISDSERIAGFLEAQEVQPAKNINEASIIIFNTCGVRQAAENRVYSLVHNIKKQATSDKRQISIILTGCLANRKDVQRKLKNKVDLFCNINDLFNDLYHFGKGRVGEGFENKLKIQSSKCKNATKNSKFEIPNTKYQILNTSFEDSQYLCLSPKYTNKHTAYVPIMTGCNNFCSYCVVPYARGREVSRPAGEIISEIKNLIKNGCQEIILLGQNVNSYKYPLSLSPSPSGRGRTDVIVGTGEGEHMNFSTLLKNINALPGKFWLSFVSSHPKDYSDELIETATKLKKVCEYIHLPIQAGDDKILEKMNRKYTQKHYLGLIRKIKGAFKKNKPGALFAISSDIIIGFPGETKKQFSASAEVMKKVKYDMVYFGQFSPRPGTAAWKMKDDVTKEEKVRRENYLNEILAKTNFGNNKKYVGRIIEVLIEQEKNGSYFGKTRTWKNVKLMSTKKKLIGKIVKAKITKANPWNLEGKII